VNSAATNSLCAIGAWANCTVCAITVCPCSSCKRRFGCCVVMRSAWAWGRVKAGGSSSTEVLFEAAHPAMPGLQGPGVGLAAALGTVGAGLHGHAAATLPNVPRNTGRGARSRFPVFCLANNWGFSLRYVQTAPRGWGTALARGGDSRRHVCALSAKLGAKRLVGEPRAILGTNRSADLGSPPPDLLS